jgi:hypothetical protein
VSSVGTLLPWEALAELWTSWPRVEQVASWAPHGARRKLAKQAMKEPHNAWWSDLLGVVVGPSAFVPWAVRPPGRALGLPASILGVV